MFADRGYLLSASFFPPGRKRIKKRLTLKGPQLQILLSLCIAGISRKEIRVIRFSSPKKKRLQHWRENGNGGAKVARELQIIGTTRGQIPVREAEEGWGNLGATDVGLGCGLGARLGQQHCEWNAARVEDERRQRERFIDGRKGDCRHNAGAGSEGGCGSVLRSREGGGEEGKERGEKKSRWWMHTKLSRKMIDIFYCSFVVGIQRLDKKWSNTQESSRCRRSLPLFPTDEGKHKTLYIYPKNPFHILY